MLRRLINRQTYFYWLVAAGLLLAMLIHLGSQPGRFSPLEQSTVNHSSSLHSIIKNPLNAPHDILNLGFSKIGGGLFTMRLSSVIWGIVCALAFFRITRSLFGKIIGLIGAVIMAATPLFLIAARQASPEIMLAAPVLIMAVFNWSSRPAADKNRALPLLIILSALMLYVPGMIWWLAGAVIAGSRKLEEALTAVSKPRLYLSLLTGVIILVPLGLAIAGDWQLMKLLALLPQHFSSPLNELKNIGWMAAAWIIKTPFHSPLIIDRLSLFNIVQAVLLAFGTFAMFKAAKTKAWTLLAAIIFATVAAGLNGNISLLLLGLPAAGLLMTTGLRYLYVEWRGVFPRNPAAKYLAVLLISALGAIQLLYGIRYALIAWPHTVSTHDTYMIK